MTDFHSLSSLFKFAIFVKDTKVKLKINCYETYTCTNRFFKDI